LLSSQRKNRALITHTTYITHPVVLAEEKQGSNNTHNS